MGFTAAGAVLTVLSLATMPASSQVPAGGAIPRTADGRPDFSGIWQALTPAAWNIQDHSAEKGVPGGQGVVEGNDIPYLPAALAKKNENYKNRATVDPVSKCYVPGIPRIMYMPFPFQIFQTDRAFFIAHEYAGAVRNVYLKNPGPPQVDSWMGQSVGKWDGSTFVIETSGFNDQSWFDRAGNHHSEALKVTERYTMTGPEHIQYEATIDDPKVFTRPWKIAMPLYRHVNKDARLGQFKCVEFVEELMYGKYRKTQ